MALRFTDPEKWKDAWFLALPNDFRIIWIYLLDNCTISGVIKKNFELLNFCCKTSVTEKEFVEVFRDRIWDGGTFFFIPKFLKFQYPTGLNSNKPMVISVKQEILLYNLLPVVQKLFGDDFLIISESFLHGLQRDYLGSSPSRALSLFPASKKTLITSSKERKNTSNNGKDLYLTKEELEITRQNEFVASLVKNPAYDHIDIVRELHKMDAWIAAKPGRRKTKMFVLNWLNKIPAPLGKTPGVDLAPQYTPEQIRSALSVKRLEEKLKGGARES